MNALGGGAPPPPITIVGVSKPLEFSLIKNICGCNVPLGNVEWR